MVISQEINQRLNITGSISPVFSFLAGNKIY